MIWHWILHVTGSDDTTGVWYGFWSGFGSDLGEMAIIGGLIHLVLRHNCHVEGCKSLLTRNDPLVHAPACGRHHSLKHLHGKDPHA